ncbi:MAG: molybdenum ABC transporter ATP-binding protein [Methyloceanibacter sp.]
MSLEVSAMARLGAFTLDVDFRSESRLTAVFGPSGSGKTSVLNVIAGLLRPESGRVAVDGAVLVDTEAGVFLPPYRRRVAYVFQDGRLFPHLSVKGNLLYGHFFARSARKSASFDEVVALLDLGPLLGRGISTLSGGEKQRVAIGRALLSSPQLLLLDEPLASLDERRKEEVMPFLEKLRDQASMPIVYVSHVMAEIERLAGTVVLMDHGRVTAVDDVSHIKAKIAERN